MHLLGIETSCDETAAAVVSEASDARHPWRIRSNVVASQIDLHREWGGVVPELASRQHLRDICGVVERSLSEAGIGLGGLGAVAVTQGPGLIGSLLVGVAFGKALALSLGVPVVPVHHLAGHIESLFLHHGPLPLPAMILVVSGGHTSLYLVPKVGDYRLVGRTRDDAAGEAYDKVAKLLGLGYPGGPVLDRMAQQGRDDAIPFPIARMTHPDRNVAPAVATPAGFGKMLEGRSDFSFSGLKTAVRRYVQKRLAELGEPDGLDGLGPGDTPATLPHAEMADVCASFQRVVVETLLDRTFEAARWFGAISVGIAGGVAANSRLRADGQARGAHAGLPVYFPPLDLSTDNAAMIAAAGLRRLRQGAIGRLDLNAQATLPMPSSPW